MSKGAQTRAAILDRAVDLASAEGLEGHAVVMAANARYRMSGDRRVFDFAREALERLGAELPAR